MPTTNGSATLQNELPAIPEARNGRLQVPVATNGSEISQSGLEALSSPSTGGHRGPPTAARDLNGVTGPDRPFL